MGQIKDDEKFVMIEISPADVIKDDSGAVHFALASLGLHFLRKAAPALAEQLHTTASATDWQIKDGNIRIFVGKKQYEIPDIRSAVQTHKETA